ncbi:hypothetical protein COU36_02540 [Candidatus Micrarchaeota archaeon CG10_big_fil_rev_8_21_14_0_10_59_7]|nr:MAG: hypothetical protein COU36_02540 [Candidatus Micrarchaeota archaeon CG10_big_fil_rev_8_21_14_0_10_59_7]
MEKKTIYFLLLFSVLGLLAYQLRFSTILGVPSQSFTFFQFVGPVGGQILSPVLGVISVALVEAGNFLLGGQPLDLTALIRLFPMMFAAFYFGTKRKEIAAVPIAAMLLFWMHPQGAQAWYYALYWLIPVAAFMFFKDNLLARSLGATFTAHCVGSVAFLYAFNIPAATWTMLIPIVALERFSFALGIAASCVAISTALDYALQKTRFKAPKLDLRYSLLKGAATRA